VTTPLVRPLSREILVAGTAYRVTLHTDHIALTRKGHRLGIEVTWDDLITSRNAEVSKASAASFTDLPRAIAGDVAREVRAATDALTRARAVLEQAGALPAVLLAEMKSDPVYGRAEERHDWFVEPLLMIAEVASILRVSRRAVRRLPIPNLSIAGGERYRQSQIRDYLRKQETRLR
jgi:hypothetical protein